MKPLLSAKSNKSLGKNRVLGKNFKKFGTENMITPIDVVCLQMIHAERYGDEAHYHLANPPLSHPRPPLEEANFHIVDRTISLNQIGFDYYDNIVTYRL